MSGQNLSASRCIVADFVKSNLNSWRRRGPIVKSKTVLSSLATCSSVPRALEYSRDDPWTIEYNNEGAGAVLTWRDGQECRLTEG